MKKILIINIIAIMSFLTGCDEVSPENKNGSYTRIISNNVVYEDGTYQKEFLNKINEVRQEGIVVNEELIIRNKDIGTNKTLDTILNNIVDKYENENNTISKWENINILSTEFLSTLKQKNYLLNNPIELDIAFGDNTDIDAKINDEKESLASIDDDGVCVLSDIKSLEEEIVNGVVEDKGIVIICGELYKK